jgi:hypothetical protein
MKVGIIGLSGSGRKTLFRLLTHAAGIDSARGAQVGVLKIPDERLARLAQIYQSRKTTPATIDFVLIPARVKADMAETLDLAALRTVDILAIVIRAFSDPSVPHPEGSVDPERDADTVGLELALADLAVVEGRLERLRADLKKGKKPDRPDELPALERAQELLAAGTPLREALTACDQQALRGYALLTAKPLLFVVNVDEKDAARSDLASELGVSARFSRPASAGVFVSARLEAEIAELAPEEAGAFRGELGLKEGTVERLLRAAFDLTGRLTFFTASEQEARAWILPRGTPAVRAAGTVHSDMERGFIRAEVVPYPVLVGHGSWSHCRDKGLVRSEGKDYPIAEGDVVYFRFHV